MEVVAKAERHVCTHIVFEDLEQIRSRGSDNRKFKGWTFRAYSKYRTPTELSGITGETVEPSYTSQQCSECGCALRQNREGKQFACLDDSYSVNADDNAVLRLRATAKTVAQKLTLNRQRGQKSPAGGNSVKK